MELKSIITGDWEHCFVCGKEAHPIHHIFNKTDKKRSEKYGLLIPVCYKCHSDIHDRNESLNKRIKKLAQTKFESKYGKELWMAEFKKSYI